MFYTTEEAAIVCGFLDLYLNRDSVDRAVREQNRRFQRSAAPFPRGVTFGARITGGRKRRLTSSSPAGGSRMRIIERCKTRC